ncbi:MAG: adenylate/guanylate cyclase domain-containing protein [Actinobacteria bacterium]|nr:adenylate/guanylate cyclase domain-containing protein [Actinomycetota bacterium]
MRVHRTFAFVDLSGFTAFTETRGDDEASRLLAGFRACVREVASDHGVRVAKWLGDGAMLVGVEDRALVAAVIDLARRVDEGDSPLAVRIGLSGGDVIVFEGDDYIGGAVNLAARLCNVAQPGEVLATTETAAVAPDGCDSTSVGERAIPGLSHPVPLVRLGPLVGGPALGEATLAAEQQ